VDELQRAQSNLGRAMARARAGEDRVLVGQFREKGEQFVNLLNGLIRMGRVHAADNRAFDQPVAELTRALEALVSMLGVVRLVTVDDQVFVNDARMKLATGTGDHALGAELKRHNVGGLTFSRELPEAQLRLLVSLLGGRASPERPRTSVLRALRAGGVQDVELFGSYRFRRTEDEGPEEAPEALARRVMRAVEETWDNVCAGRQANVLALRRLVVDLAVLGPGHPELWLIDFSQLSPHGAHGFRMAQLVLLASQAAGLPPSLQQDYCVAALVHDVGYAVRAARPIAFDGHGMAGARALLRQLGFHEAKVRRTFGALYHHADLELHGQRPPLVSRLLRLAEDYETMTRPGGAGLTPPEALGQLAAGANRHYDPVLTQVFINVLGAFPPGTFLALEDGRVVRTCSTVRKPELFGAPLAVVMRAADGSPPTPRQVIDLATEGKVRGALKPRR
jgi:hypothetical protein